MSISMTKAEGVTVLTLTSDSQSNWPPLCQILKALCYNPRCCNVSERLRGIQRSSQSSLGILQIIHGLLNIGLGILLLVIDVYMYPLRYTFFPVWLGVLFMVFGTMCILSEKYPSPCMVILNVLLNLAGVAFAITGIVLYSITLGNVYFWQNCYYYHYYGTTPSPSRDFQSIQQNCLWFQSMALMLIRGICGLLIVLSALQLCVSTSAFILGIKALRKRASKEAEDPEPYKPILEDVTAG